MKVVTTYGNFYVVNLRSLSFSAGLWGALVAVGILSPQADLPW